MHDTERLLRVALVFGVAFACASLRGQTPKIDHTVDLTLRPALNGNESVGLPEDSAGFTSGMSRQPVPLEVVLMPPEQLDLRWGERYVFEVLLRNRGDEPIRVPWSYDVGLVRTTHTNRNPPERTLIGFEIWSGDQQLAFLPGAMLYGTDTLRGSLLSLQKGETALIRIPTTLSTSESGYRAASNRAARGEQLEILARVSLLEALDRQIRPSRKVAVTIQSANGTEQAQTR